jgi:flavin-dependent dehydrogenase
MYFDFAAVPGGYGWVFPKGDHLNVGLYTQQEGVTFSKDDLRAYSHRILGTDRIDDIVGYPLGVGGEHFQQNWKRVFLVGDAAGGAERLLGEGIHNAIKTGQGAAEAVLASLRRGESGPASFARRLGEVQRDLEACSTAANWFYQVAGLGYSALRFHPAKTALMRGFAAGKTFREILQTALFSPLYTIRPVASIVEYERAEAIRLQHRVSDARDLPSASAL